MVKNGQRLLVELLVAMSFGSCLVASGWSGPARDMCSWIAHGSCPPRCRVVKVQQCVRGFLLLGRDSGPWSTALIIEYVFLTGRQTQKRLFTSTRPPSPRLKQEHRVTLWSI